MWASFIFVITRTGQSGLLLYASMIHWSPDHLLLSPGLAERMQPFPVIAAELWEHRMVEHVKLRKAMVPELRAFVLEQGIPKKAMPKAVNDAAKRAGVEIAVRNFWRIPGYAVEKFFIAHRELPAPDFTEFPHTGQVGALFERGKAAAKISLMLWGVPLSTREEVTAFMRAHYDVSPGATLTPFLASFVQAGLLSHRADATSGNASWWDSLALCVRLFRGDLSHRAREAGVRLSADLVRVPLRDLLRPDGDGKCACQVSTYFRTLLVHLFVRAAG